MAYGTNAPFGLRPVSYLGSGPIPCPQNSYFVAYNYATALFTGDPVTLLADGTIGRATGANNGPVSGVFAGVQYYDVNNNLVNLPYWPNPAPPTFRNQNPVAFVLDDPNILYDIQAGNAAGSGGAGILQVDLFSNATIGFGTAGSTVSGQSGAVLLAIDNTATSPLKILRLTPVPGNAFGVNYNNVIVQINDNPLRGSTGSGGV